jgi:hypothetical protein
VTDAAHAQLRAAGALVEEAVDEDEEDADASVGGHGELILDEKSALASGVPTSTVVNVPLRGKTERPTTDADTSAEAVGGFVGSWMSGRSSVTNTSVLKTDYRTP